MLLLDYLEILLNFLSEPSEQFPLFCRLLGFF